MSEAHLTGAIDQHFRGAIDPDVERKMRAHLSTCDACHAHYRRRLVFAALDPKALSAEERIGRALGIAKRPPLFIVGPTALRVAAVLALAALLLLWLRPKDDGFQGRGLGALTNEPQTRVLVYRVADGGTSRVMDSVRSDDELAFAYDNGAKKERLMIFGVDEHGHVFWFHPAWDDAAQNPVAIAIAPGRNELREAVKHAYDGEQLEIHALFLDGPLTVETVEAMIRKKKAPLGPIAFPNAIDHVTPLKVSR